MRNAHEQGSDGRKKERIDEQIENVEADKKVQKENLPRVEIKSQENVLSGLSDKERLQASEVDNNNMGILGNDMDGSDIGLSDKERSEAAEADGRGGNEVINSGLSDKERRGAADEDW